jgi:hypothetical protein
MSIDNDPQYPSRHELTQLLSIDCRYSEAVLDGMGVVSQSRNYQTHHMILSL